MARRHFRFDHPQDTKEATAPKPVEATCGSLGQLQVKTRVSHQAQASPQKQLAISRPTKPTSPDTRVSAKNISEFQLVRISLSRLKQEESQQIDSLEEMKAQYELAQQHSATYKVHSKRLQSDLLKLQTICEVRTKSLGGLKEVIQELRSRKEELTKAFKGTAEAESKFHRYVGHLASACQRQQAETASLQTALANATNPKSQLLTKLEAANQRASELSSKLALSEQEQRESQNRLKTLQEDMAKLALEDTALSQNLSELQLQQSKKTATVNKLKMSMEDLNRTHTAKHMADRCLLEIQAEKARMDSMLQKRELLCQLGAEATTLEEQSKERCEHLSQLIAKTNVASAEIVRLSAAAKANEEKATLIHAQIEHATQMKEEQCELRRDIALKTAEELRITCKRRDDLALRLDALKCTAHVNVDVHGIQKEVNSFGEDGIEFKATLLSLKELLVKKSRALCEQLQSRRHQIGELEMKKQDLTSKQQASQKEAESLKTAIQDLEAEEKLRGERTSQVAAMADAIQKWRDEQTMARDLLIQKIKAMEETKQAHKDTLIKQRELLVVAKTRATKKTAQESAEFMKHISAAKSKQAAHLAQQAREILELKEQLQALEKRRNELKQLEAEEAERRLEAEKTRAEAEKSRAEAEKSRAEAEKSRLEAKKNRMVMKTPNVAKAPNVVKTPSAVKTFSTVKSPSVAKTPPKALSATKQPTVVKKPNPEQTAFWPVYGKQRGYQRSPVKSLPSPSRAKPPRVSLETGRSSKSRATELSSYKLQESLSPDSDFLFREPSQTPNKSQQGAKCVPSPIVSLKRRGIKRPGESAEALASTLSAFDFPEDESPPKKMSMKTVAFPNKKKESASKGRAKVTNLMDRLHDSHQGAKAWFDPNENFWD